METCDVLVVGGGVIGLSLAWRLAQRGQRVTVLDANTPGQASRAAAGMLAPLAEAHGPGPAVRLGLESLALYPAFLEELRAASGQGVELTGPGMLRVAAGAPEADALQQSLLWQSALGLPLEWLDTDVLRAREPHLSPALVGAVFSPKERHVTPRALHHALHEVCRRAGVRLHQNTRLTGLQAAGARATTADTSAGTFSFGQVVMASGAWTEMLSIRLPITPLRGQALTLHSGLPLPFTHTIYAKQGYLVPRDDGTLVAGATEEHAGFDPATTPAALDNLRAAASALVPCTAALSVHEHWAGLRPVTPDSLPLLGPVPGFDNLFLAAGHGRNGILLTPLTAQLMTQLLLNNAPPPPETSPARFTPNP